MATFKPLTLLQTRSYPGYQFYATLKYKDQKPTECMKYTILTVMDWLRDKIDGDMLPEELKTPSPQKFTRVADDVFKSYHYSGGFSLDITSLISQGIWAARIKEPDTERNDRKAIIGRFFITDIGIHCIDDSVELGVKIDVLDPVNVPEEVPYAYRPQFIRRLFETRRLKMTQVKLLKYNQPNLVNNPMALKHLLELIPDPNNYMPIMVLTYAADQKKVKELIERLDKNLGLRGKSNSFSKRLAQLDTVPEMLEIGDPLLPYDAEYMAYHTFGYGRVYVVDKSMFEGFKKSEYGSDLKPGDMIWIEPARFGGNTRIIRYDPQDPAGVREYRRNKLVEDAHGYSKKKNVSFGAVVFEAKARRIEVEEHFKIRLEEIRSNDEIKAEQKADEIYKETQELLALYEEDKRMDDEEKKLLNEEIDRLNKENQNLTGKVTYLEERNERISEAKEGIVIQVPRIEEFYEDEQKDLIVSILMEAKRSFCTEGTRADELLDGIVAENELTGEGKKLFERLKVILFRNKNITDSDISDLEALGFEVTRRPNNHYKLVFKGNPKYSFTLASTGSDVRGMKNSFSDISNQLSVYK